MNNIGSNDEKLPFVERFRPKTLDDVISHHDIIYTLKSFIKTQNIPHLLFYGPPGTGKTSTIEAFVTELYGDDNVEFMTMNINASEERGIEIVRNKISNFVKTGPVYRVPTDKKLPVYKFVILDEADAMTLDAQATLRKVIESYTYNARFCLICNYIKGIDDAIRSRCTVFKFSSLDYDSVVGRILEISKISNVSITEDGLNMMWKLSNGDMRKVLHMIQVISIGYKIITADVITCFHKYPTDDDINTLYKVFICGDIGRSVKELNKIVRSKGYALIDIVNELSQYIVQNLINHSLDKKIGSNVILRLRDIEMNLIVTQDTQIQIMAIASVFC